MAAQTRQTLKGVFEQGDTPQGSDYENLIDSFVSLSDSTAQTMTSDLTVAGLVATTAHVVQNLSVSGNATITGAVAAGTLTVGGQAVATGGATDQGYIYITATAVTSTTTQGAYYNVSAATWVAGDLRNFSARTTDGALVYTGANPRRFAVHATFTMTSDDNSKTYGFRLAKNGTTDTTTTIERMVGTGSDKGAAAISGIVSANNQDAIQIYAAALDATPGNVTMEKLNFMVHSI